MPYQTPHPVIPDEQREDPESSERSHRTSNNSITHYHTGCRVKLGMMKPSAFRIEHNMTQYTPSFRTSSAKIRNPANEATKQASDVMLKIALQTSMRALNLMRWFPTRPHLK